jgi:hypothetical protein
MPMRDQRRWSRLLRFRLADTNRVDIFVFASDSQVILMAQQPGQGAPAKRRCGR